MTPAGLAGLLAEHAFVYRMRTRKDDNGEPEPYEEEITPARDAVALALALAAKTLSRSVAGRFVLG
jgi:hypothetical protein